MNPKEHMKTVLKIEYIYLFIVGVYGYSLTGISWWWFIGLFFAPDLSMLGYLKSPRIGAALYNLFHHFGTGILCFLLVRYLDSNGLEVAGIILFSHSAFDRIFGFGLKYPDSFHNTHLGKIGGEK